MVVEVEVLVFFMPLLLFILDLRSIRPFILEPLCMSDEEPLMLPLCIVPLCIEPEPLVVPVVEPLCIEPEVVPGVVWAKAAVLRKKAQAAVRMVVFMTMIA